MQVFCFKHNILHPVSDPCARCSMETSAATFRATLGILESRIADLEDVLLRAKLQLGVLATDVEVAQKTLDQVKP